MWMTTWSRDAPVKGVTTRLQLLTSKFEEKKWPDDFYIQIDNIHIDPHLFDKDHLIVLFAVVFWMENSVAMKSIPFYNIVVGIVEHNLPDVLQRNKNDCAALIVIIMRDRTISNSRHRNGFTSTIQFGHSLRPIIQLRCAIQTKTNWMALHVVYE